MIAAYGVFGRGRATNGGRSGQSRSKTSWKVDSESDELVGEVTVEVGVRDGNAEVIRCPVRLGINSSCCLLESPRKKLAMLLW